MKKISTIFELFAFFLHRRKFYMFPIIFLLIIMIGFTALSQTGFIAFVYPI